LPRLLVAPPKPVALHLLLALPLRPNPHPRLLLLVPPLDVKLRLLPVQPIKRLEHKLLITH
jgi:hypothetical protein